MDQNPEQLTYSSYSTIFQCTEDSFTCFLRFLEGLISLILLLLLAKGYKTMSAQSNNPISNQDKRIYFLAMSQTLLVAFYYFLFEQFFILATIRNLLIWISLNLTGLFCKMYWIDNESKLKIINYAMKVLGGCNFLLWFIVAVSHGSQIINTNFNLGYNCLTMDWIVLSGLLLLVAGGLTVIGVLKADQLTYEIAIQTEKHKVCSTEDPLTNKNIESLTHQRLNIMLLCGGSIVGASIMFIWDFTAYIVSDTPEMCVQIFSGNTLFRKILCFLLKIFSMQVVPALVYYIFYEKKKEQFLLAQSNKQMFMNDIDYLADDAASDLNRSLTDRMDSRKSVFSSGSNPYL